MTQLFVRKRSGTDNFPEIFERACFGHGGRKHAELLLQSPALSARRREPCY
jgi:hypothetical protein